jgi:hypothetical protein
MVRGLNDVAHRVYTTNDFVRPKSRSSMAARGTSGAVCDLVRSLTSFASPSSGSGKRGLLPRLKCWTSYILRDSGRNWRTRT